MKLKEILYQIDFFCDFCFDILLSFASVFDLCIWCILWKVTSDIIRGVFYLSLGHSVEI